MASTLNALMSTMAEDRQWRHPKVLFGLMTFELLFAVPCLAIFGIAQPDLYRTRFWQFGSDQGWNSNPNQLIYAYANYRPIQAPLPWRQFTTKWSFVISILTVFILLVKSVMLICSVFHPLVSLIVHAGLAAIWAVAIHNQAASDMSDPLHPQPGAPWYITKSCGPPVSPSLVGYCRQAKAGFSFSILLVVIYVGYLSYTLFALYQWMGSRASRKSERPENDQPWEMLEAPKQPRMTGGLMSPTTPRTKAFNKLSGNSQPKPSTNKGVQLRHHIAMGDDVYRGPNGS